MSNGRPRAALVAALAALFIALPATASATWTGGAGPGSARSAALTMPTGNQPTASVREPGGSTVDVSWPGSSSGPLVTAFEVRSYDASTGTARTVGASCAGIVVAASCSEAGVANGTWRYAVVPRNQAWAGAESALSDPIVVDTTPPTIAIAFPVHGSTYSSTSWDAGCATAICGSAADVGSNVASVDVSVRQGSGAYWTGTAFASASEVLLDATGTTTWRLPIAAASFPADGAYTVRAVVTDAAGGSAAASATFTMDRTGPAPTAMTLFNASGAVTAGTDEVRITFSEPVAVSSICSAWSGTGDQSLGGAGVVVTIADGVLSSDVVTIASGACTLHVGSVATGGNYVLSTSTYSGSAAGTESRLAWTAATRTLTIHLGSQASGLANVLPQSASTATYTPDAAITDSAGNAVNPAGFPATGQRF